MERESQPARARLIKALQPQASRLNFYRFCQLLEQADPTAPPLGSTSVPGDDPIRFRPHPGMGFPAGEIKAIEQDQDNPQLPCSVRTTFLGLYGVDAPLPSHYLDDIAQQREGHEAVTAFLDIFNHRLMAQFYRIWRKYAYPATFQAGGNDAISQCLLGLIGLGIPGTAQRVATPISRFLALLSTMRLPTRTSEGIQALVRLLAPNTRVRIQPHDPATVVLAQPAGFSAANRVALSQRTALGKTGKDANSRVKIHLSTEDRHEAASWLPGGQCHTDLLVLMRVYLGYRCDARLVMTVATDLLPEARLSGTARLQLGRTAVLGLKPGKTDNKTGSEITDLPGRISVCLGQYQGVQPTVLLPAESGEYRFC